MAKGSEAEMISEFSNDSFISGELEREYGKAMEEGKRFFDTLT
jgi:hypothetical protein